MAHRVCFSGSSCWFKISARGYCNDETVQSKLPSPWQRTVYLFGRGGLISAGKVSYTWSQDLFSPQLLEHETFQLPLNALCSEKRKYYEWTFLNPSFSVLRARAWSKTPDKYEDPNLALWELSSITHEQRSGLILRSDCSLQSLFCYISRPQGSINYVAFIHSICTACLL